MFDAAVWPFIQQASLAPIHCVFQSTRHQIGHSLGLAFEKVSTVCIPSGGELYACPAARIPTVLSVKALQGVGNLLYVWTVSPGVEPRGSDLPTNAPSCEVLL
jgi:hypothetical protein